MKQPPLPLLPRSPRVEDDFEAMRTLIAAAQDAFAQREEPYNPALQEKLLNRGISLGGSAARSCAHLHATEPFWCCVIARTFLEYALRLLWASREADGICRMHAHYSREYRSFMRALAEKDTGIAADLDDLDRRFPASSLPSPMPRSLKDVMQSIRDADARNGVQSMFLDAGHYTQSVRFLHNFAHANPLHLGGGRADYLPHAAHGMADATSALLRALGYRLGWDQNATACRVFAIQALETLTVEERQLLDEQLHGPR